MKLPMLAILPVAALSACHSAPPRESPNDALLHTYTVLSEVVNAGVDQYDATDLNLARQCYNKAYSLLQTDPEATVLLAEKSTIAAELALARTQAQHAAAQRSALQDEVAALEKLSTPTAPLQTVAPPRRRGRP